MGRGNLLLNTGIAGDGASYAAHPGKRGHIHAKICNNSRTPVQSRHGGFCLGLHPQQSRPMMPIIVKPGVVDLAPVQPQMMMTSRGRPNMLPTIGTAAFLPERN